MTYEVSESFSDQPYWLLFLAAFALKSLMFLCLRKRTGTVSYHTIENSRHLRPDGCRVSFCNEQEVEDVEIRPAIQHDQWASVPQTQQVLNTTQKENNATTTQGYFFEEIFKLFFFSDSLLKWENVNLNILWRDFFLFDQHYPMKITLLAISNWSSVRWTDGKRFVSHLLIQHIHQIVHYLDLPYTWGRKTHPVTISTSRADLMLLYFDTKLIHLPGIKVESRTLPSVSVLWSRSMHHWEMLVSPWAFQSWKTERN